MWQINAPKVSDGTVIDVTCVSNDRIVKGHPACCRWETCKWPWAIFEVSESALTTGDSLKIKANKLSSGHALSITATAASNLREMV